MVETPREALARLAAVQGVSLSALSRMLGRNVAYLQQYVGRGSPKVLPEAERGRLAQFLGVAESVLGAPMRDEGTGEVTVPFLSVAASAGPGQAAGDERIVRGLPFARAALRDLGIAPADASVILVAGDSMAPTLVDGDRVLVDRGDRSPGRGIFVIREGDLLSVKRLATAPAGYRIVSDNPDFAARHADAAALAILGRARLVVREV